MNHAPSTPRQQLYIVLATRGIALSKSRLAPALTVRERAELNRWLLERTLNVIGAWIEDMRRCIAVSACAEALGMAAGRGARTVEEPGGARGHNHAAAVGAAEAVKLGAQRIAFVPADLPDLNMEALDEFIACASRAELVLAPDKDGPGTNAVIARAAPDLAFFFGPGSLARYVQWGVARGWRVALHASPELAFDLDTPEDYAAWTARAHGAHGNAPERGALAV